MATLYEAARAVGIPFEREWEPRQGTFDTGELTLRFLEWGPDDARPILLLHGFAQTAHSWDFVSLALAGTYRVLALDSRGHGDSDWAPDGDYSADAYRRDLAALIDGLGLAPLPIVGSAIGGRHAYTLAGLSPEYVCALAIIDVGPVTATKGSRRIRRFVSLPDERDSYEDFVQAIHEYQPHRAIQQIRGTLKYNIRETPEGKWTWKYDRALRDPERRNPEPPEEESFKIFRAIRCPTLLVRGERSDVLTEEMATRMADAIPECEFVEVPRAGHTVPGDNPVGFLRVMTTWLAKVYPPI